MARVGVRFDGVSTGARKAAAETRAAVKGVGDQADRDTKRIALMGPALRRTFALATVGLTLFAGASVVAFKKSVDAASNLTEQVNKTRVVFAGAEKEVLAWSKTTTQAIGISQRAALEYAGTFGNMLVPMGFARKEAAQLSMQLVQLAGDMASFNNASPEETLEALRAGLAGETEPLRRFGVRLSEARIQQEALNAGLIQGKEKLTDAGKATAIYRIILKDTADQQGDAARTIKEHAGQQRVLAAVVEDSAAKLGNVFKPAVTAAMRAVNEWLGDENNIRMLERWAETLQEGVATALRAIAGWVRSNGDDVLAFFQETADAAAALAQGADGVAKAMGGYDDAFKLILSGVLAAKFARIATLVSGKGGILAGLTRIKALGPTIAIAMVIDLSIDEKKRQAIAGMAELIANKVGINDARWVPILGIFAKEPTAAAAPATTTPQGTVADPRGGSVGSLTPQSGGGGGGVSFTAGVTKPNQHVIAFVARVAAVYGAPLNINSGFRPGSRVKDTGAPSQHGTGDAADIGPYYGAQLTAIGQAALIAAGMPEALAYKQTSFVDTVNGVNILFNTNVGGNHFNHVHVGLRSLPAAASTSPETVSPEAVDTSAATSTAAPTSAKAGIDRHELQAARGTAAFINKHLESIASPTLRARIRQRGLKIAEILAEVTDPKAFARAKRNLNALERDFENAVKLTAATKQAQATARNIGSALGRMPEAMQRELGPRLAQIERDLGNVTSKRQLDGIRKRMDELNAIIKAGVEKMRETVERGRSVVGSALGKAADKALQVLDAKTEELLRKARALVGGELLGEGDLGPAGRALRDFRAARAAADRASSRAAALAGAETEEERAALAAQHALEDQEETLQRAAEEEERAIAEGLERERARIRDERSIVRERFQGRYEEIVRGFQEETLTAEQAQRALLDLLADPEWAQDFASAGALVGAAFAASFDQALAGITAAVLELRAAVQELADATGVPMPGETTAERALRIRSEAMNKAHRLGRYVRAGNLVSSSAGSSGGGGGGGAGTTVVLPPVQAVFNLDGQAFAVAVAQPVSDEQARRIGYRHERA